MNRNNRTFQNKDYCLSYQPRTSLAGSSKTLNPTIKRRLSL